MESVSYFLPVNDTDTLHLKRLYDKPDGPVAFLLHGSIENGRIFYSKSGKGFGPFLARQGYDVYIPDSRGRGESQPDISRSSQYGNYELITEDMPLFLEEIRKLRGEVPMVWIAHSWGGVMMQCYLTRFPQTPVNRMAFFGVTRRKRIQNVARFLNIDLAWRLLMPQVVALKGYVPAKSWGFGGDNETRQTFVEGEQWMFHAPWIERQDGFDYHQALSGIDLPPTLYLAGGADRFLAHPQDIQRHMAEVPNTADQYWELSRKEGFRHDYDHNNMLTHPQAEQDHYYRVLAWLEEGKF